MQILLDVVDEDYVEVSMNRNTNEPLDNIADLGTCK